MQTFESVLKLLNKGGLGSLWEEVTDSDRLPPAIAESSKKFNDCLKQLYSLEVKSDFDRLESIVAEDSPVSPEELAEVSERLGYSESVATEFLSSNFKRKSALRKAAQIAATSKSLNSVLRYLTTKYSGQLKVREKEIKEGNLEVCRALRPEMDAINEEYWKVYRLAEERGVKIDSKIHKLFSDYKQKKEAIEDIKRRITSIHSRYLTVSSKKEPLKALQKLRKEVKSRGLFKSEIVKDCVSADYYEGLAGIKELEKDICHVLTDFDQLTKVRNRLIQNNSRVQSYLADVQGMQEGDFSLADLRKLRSVRENVSVDKYVSYESVIYLQELISEYKRAVDLLQSEVAKLTKQETESLKTRLQFIDSMSKEVPKAMAEISSYISLVDSFENQLKEINARCRILGYDAVSKSTAELSEENQKRRQELKNISSAYEKLKRIRKKAASLKEDAERYGVTSERIDELAALNAESRSKWPNITYQGLRKEYNSAVDGLKQGIESAVNACVASVDRRYEESEKNPSYNLDEVLEFYERIGAVRGISDRVEKTRALIEQRIREKQEADEKARLEREYALKKQKLDGEYALRQNELQQKSAALEVKGKELDVQIKQLEIERATADKTPARVVESSKVDGYYLDGLFNGVTPQNHSLEVLGNVLLGYLPGNNWMRKMAVIRREVTSLAENRCYASEPQDFEYLNSVAQAIDLSLQAGHLKREAGRCSGNRREIYDTMKQINDFIEESKKHLGERVGV